MRPPRAVAVTGLGVASPFGWGVEPFWDGLVAGRSALAAIARFPTVASRLGGAVPARTPAEVARSPLARRMDWPSLMAVGACALALEDAGLAAADLPHARTSLALGSAFGNLQETATFLDRLFARGTGNPLVFPNLVFNAPLAYATIELGIRGETAMLSMLEASGESAIAWGIDAVAAGRADVCLAGGVDELGAVLHRVLEDGGRLAAGEPRPLDAAADGVALAEGAGVLVLEPADAAAARGARVYALAEAPPAATVAAPVHGWPRDPAAVAVALAPALSGADLVVAQAAGHPGHDALEARALGQAAPGAAVTAIRGATGDFGAAGALAAVAAALCVARGLVPPTRGFERPLERALDVVAGRARAMRVGAAVLPGLASGGICRPLRLRAAPAGR